MQFSNFALAPIPMVVDFDVYKSFVFPRQRAQGLYDPTMKPTALTRDHMFVMRVKVPYIQETFKAVKMQRRFYMFAIDQMVRRNSPGNRSPSIATMIQARLQRSYQVHMQRARALSAHHMYDELKVEKERCEAAQTLLVMRKLSMALHQRIHLSRLSVIPEGDHEGEDPETKMHHCLLVNVLIKIWRRHRCVPGCQTA